MQSCSDVQRCTNCQNQYPIDRIDLHEAYCCRNIRKCAECQKMIDINEQQNHNKQHHAKQICEQCKIQFFPRQMQQHHQNCPMRIVLCHYCQIGYAKNTLQVHQQSCSTRTRPCSICSKLVILKQINAHEIRCQRRRDQVSQQPYRPNHRNQGRQDLDIERQNSTNNGRQIPRKHSTSINKIQHKNQKIKPSNIIGIETIKQPIDPVPISIRLALRSKQQRPPLKIKN